MKDRILFYMHSNDLFNDNHYGFIPQKGTLDIAMEVKIFIEESLRLNQRTILVSLDFKGISCVLLSKQLEAVKRT